jgi:hypothetical protein
LKTVLKSGIMRVMADFCCDMCGKPLLVDEDVRYILRVEVFAAYDPMELTAEDLKQDHLAEIRELVKRMEAMDPKELEDQVYQKLTFEVCPACRKKYVAHPLPPA